MRLHELGARSRAARDKKLALIAMAALAALALALAGSSSASSRSKTYYAIGKRVCALPKKHTSLVAHCDAMVRVLVKAGTKGAQAFVPAAGAIGAGTLGPNNGLTPSDLATAYGIDPSLGSTQTVAIVDAYNDPNINTDLQTFDTQYGLSTCSTGNGCLTVVNQTGGTMLPASDTSGWSVEESLDVEAVRAVCQGCKILLVEANSPTNSDLGTAENYAAAHANEVSNSFGEPEAGTDSTFQAAFNHTGVVIAASAGDDGYYSYDQWVNFANANQPNIPAAYPTVVAVGGTSLNLGQDATRQSETVWNDNGPQDFWEFNFGVPIGAGGGGCSTMFTAPGWQSSEAVWASTACGSNRLVADVSAVGDPLTGFDVRDTYDCGAICESYGVPGWVTIGGTSLSSPLIAGMYALAGGAKGIPYPALTAYAHIANAYDVTVGGNGWCDGIGAAGCANPNSPGEALDCAYTANGGAVAAGDRACDALKGFDGPTGVGTPNGSTVGAPHTPKLFTRAAPAVVISGPTSVTHNVSSMWSATATDPFPGGTVNHFTWNWGDGTANTVMTTGAAVSHTYTTAGPFTITLTVKDNYNVVAVKTLNITAS